ncbi:hypothetical protein HK100_009987 [Physocladia obscura]|uniref:Protein kinase domain-containing protein n=1 Tax=Physocladia obscura TaxID=109957 RepID=A0AAD5T2T5_9FUNG|nr:hypothetical protein HK100_009987 [Physocladia obscura]
MTSLKVCPQLTPASSYQSSAHRSSRDFSSEKVSNNSYTATKQCTRIFDTVSKGNCQDKRETLYLGLSSEDRARKAVMNAFAKSPAKLIHTYSVISVVGFGSNGVILAALSNLGKQSYTAPLAIKIIYKAKPGMIPVSLYPPEIQILQRLTTAQVEIKNSPLVTYIDSWQDLNHFYLVTNYCGTDWESHSNNYIDTTHPRNVSFQSRYLGEIRTHSFPITTGSNDLWQWSYALRCYNYYHNTNAKASTIVPRQAIKHVIRQIAQGLSFMHSQGIYHGDVKIENVICEHVSGSLPRTYLTDFGHAQYAEYGIKQYGTQTTSGPEFLQDSPFIDNQLDGRASDVFALGVALMILVSERGEEPESLRVINNEDYKYFAVLKARSGQFPFVENVEDVGHDFWNLVDGMCRVDPRERLTIEQILQHSWLQ